MEVSPLTLLARASGSVVLMGAPSGTEIFVDMYSFEPGTSFMGVKLLAPGMHLLASSPNVGGIRSWMWFEVVAGGSVHVARWSTENEAFVIVASAPASALPGATCGSAADEALIRAARNLELDQRLGALPAQATSAWSGLSRFLTRDTVLRIACPSSSGVNGASVSMDMSPGIAAELEADRVRALDAHGDAPASACDESARLRFSQISGLRAADGVSARAQHAIDPTAALLQAVAASTEGGCTFLGEVEAAFMLVLVGNSFQALEAWKGFCDAGLRAHDALIGRCGDARALGASFFVSLYQVLCAQLSALPADFFGSDIASGAFLGPALESLLRTARQAARDGALCATDAPINARAVRCVAGKLLVVARDHLSWKPRAKGAAEQIGALLAGRALSVTNDADRDVLSLLQTLTEDGGDDDAPAIVDTEAEWV
jgi:hypothetical protein